MSAIPKHFIEDVVARTDLVQLIQSRVQIKKKGQNYSGLCPFHQEKTPSFSVNPNKQFFYCFGCGAHGDAISFLMQYEHMEFTTAIEHLAGQLGIEVPHQQTAEYVEKKSLYTVLEKSAKYYQEQLKISQTAINYLKSRGLTGIIAKQFLMGYAPQGWTNLQNIFPEKEKELLKKAGLVIEKTASKNYDRFRERIMFPIRDANGRIIGFGGRSLGDEQPKYLNSPETPTFHKSEELYGLYETRLAHSEITQLIVVEGYMDVISLHQHGINYAVATLGTAVNNKHLHKLLRYTNKIIFCFDGDLAGQKAAWKALTISLPFLRDGVHFHFLFLPTTEDPDSLVRKIDKSGFEKLIGEAPPIQHVFFEKLSEDFPLKNMDGKAHFAKATNEYIAQMPNGIYRQLMYQTLADLLQVPVQDLDNLQQPQNHATKVAAPMITPTAPTKLASVLKKSIALLLKQPSLALNVPSTEDITRYPFAGIDLFIRLIEHCKKEPSLTAGNLLRDWPDTKEREWFALLTARELGTPIEGYSAEFHGTLKQLHIQYAKYRSDQLIHKLKANQALTPDERVELEQLLQETSGTKSSRLE